VPELQRIDLDGTAPPSDQEIQRRWTEFHAAVRAASGSRSRQFLARVLGEDTLRRRALLVVVRPLLRARRAARSSGPPPSRDAAAFPSNYEPPPSPLTPREAFGPPTSEVQIIRVDETAPDASSAVATLNDVLASTQARWLLLLDPGASDLDANAAAAALVAHVEVGDVVVFADESGPDSMFPILKSRSVGPHTLLSYNCVGRPALLNVTTLRASGGFSPDAGWAFEHDAYLRLSEAGAKFRHVPLVLPGGRPPAGFSHDHVSDDTCRVVQAALNRRGWRGSVARDALAGSVRWSLEAALPRPSIDIIIPTRDRLDLLRRCIDSVVAATTYDNYDIIVLDNDSKDRATLEYLADLPYRVVACPGPFNYARIVNRGVAHSGADYVVTLNNDTLVITPDWLEQMVSLASLSDVAVVGACLIDQHGHHEHDGIVIAPYPQHLRVDSNYPHHDQFVDATRDVAAVTGAVQMVRRSLWESLGGMDEQFEVVMNDVDLCLRSQLEGRYVVFTPAVQLIHHAGSSRGNLDPIADRNRFVRRWDIFGAFRDPFFAESVELLGSTVCYRPR
jgi:GT2 family glycosyltransferase